MSKKLVKNVVGGLVAAATRPFAPRSLARAIGFAVERVAKSRSPKDGLILLLELEQQLFYATGAEACRYGNGVHTKHRHTGYHDFFCGRLEAGERVIDIGCGNGALAFDMGRVGAYVIGIDINEENIATARRLFHSDNVTYLHGDVLEGLPEGEIDTAVMSNVLEHIDGRVEFLREVQKKLTPKRWLLRVPMYERDWRVPLMDEVGVDYRQDITHFTEYTQESFQRELQEAGLEITYSEIRWGETWAEAVPVRNTQPSA